MRGFGIYKIAHHLREHNWDVEVIDYTVGWTLEELKELAKSRINSDTKFIGFGHLWTSWNEAYESFCEWIRLNYSNIVFIAGSQSFPTYESKYIDHYIVGHGENALLALLANLFSNGLPLIKTEFPWTDKKVILANSVHSTYSAGLMTNLEVQYQDRDFIREGEWLTMEFSRGCKFACKFCDFPYLNAKGNYIIAKENFVRQMKENYDRFGVKEYICADNTFNETTNKIKLYADGVEELDFDPYFTGFIRADLLIARPEDKEHLLRMNFLSHAYGIETFNKAAGSAIGKGMDPDRVKQGLIDIRNYFKTHGRKLFSSTCSYIVGLPYETKQSIQETIDWIHATKQYEFYTSIHALVIPRYEYGAAAEFTKNWKNHDYTEIVDDSVEGIRDTSRNIINWKNQHMTMQEAEAIAQTVDRSSKSMDVWLLAANSMLGIDVEDRLKMSHDYIDTPEGISKAQDFVRNYINQKLNWTPK
jgi:radical SAM superfamily enzyme YgiQ (UPF0313 family)